MHRLLLHIIVPLIISLAFFINAFTPVEVLGCRTRGLVALIIAFISAIGALVTMIIGLKTKLAKDKNSFWWVITALILTMPVIGLIILA
jgi:hypothetical protein